MHLLLTTARRLALPILRHLAQLGTLSRSRRDLRRLDDRLLRDIGLPPRSGAPPWQAVRLLG